MYILLRPRPLKGMIAERILNAHEAVDSHSELMSTRLLAPQRTPLIPLFDVLTPPARYFSILRSHSNRRGLRHWLESLFTYGKGSDGLK